MTRDSKTVPTEAELLQQIGRLAFWQSLSGGILFSFIVGAVINFLDRTLMLQLLSQRASIALSVFSIIVTLACTVVYIIVTGRKARLNLQYHRLPLVVRIRGASTES